METTYQEKILSSMLETMSNDMQYSKFTIIETVKDCFSISRIQSEIRALSQTAAFNENPRLEMVKQYDELKKILSKYPNAIDAKTTLIDILYE